MTPNNLQKKVEETVRYSGLVSFGTEPKFRYLHDWQRKIAEKLIKDLTSLIQDEKRKSYEDAAMIVIKRTEIPSDAKEPNHDFVAALGEQLAHLIRKRKEDNGNIN